MESNSFTPSIDASLLSSGPSIDSNMKSLPLSDVHSHLSNPSQSEDCLVVATVIEEESEGACWWTSTETDPGWALRKRHGSQFDDSSQSVEEGEEE
ncbi:unnamed protein product [Cuscuta europaea]|uniref:Uncharacterized protein n=1 Tax=Cuscuta europaea TaxID=41803 RepID=A0A9P0Z437_CUSEU|nr:unnamed protein product [Cuscuta europaea]